MSVNLQDQSMGGSTSAPRKASTQNQGEEAAEGSSSSDSGGCEQHIAEQASHAERIKQCCVEDGLRGILWVTPRNQLVYAHIGGEPPPLEKYLDADPAARKRLVEHIHSNPGALLLQAGGCLMRWVAHLQYAQCTDDGVNQFGFPIMIWESILDRDPQWGHSNRSMEVCLPDAVAIYMVQAREEAEIRLRQKLAIASCAQPQRRVQLLAILSSCCNAAVSSYLATDEQVTKRLENARDHCIVLWSMRLCHESHVAGLSPTRLRPNPPSRRPNSSNSY